MFFKVPRKGRGSLVRRESKPGRRHAEARLRLESLEERQMLSASPLLAALSHLGPSSSPPASSGVTLHVTPINSYYGQSVEMTAKIPGATGGTVEFLDNGVQLGTTMTVTANGVANYMTSSLTVASHPIMAAYTAPDGTVTDSSTVTEQVNADPTHTTVTATGNPVVITGSNTTATATFTATVTGGGFLGGKSGQGVPSGNVTFTITGGSTGPVATQVALDASGKAVYAPALPQGTYNVSVMYDPDPSSNYATSDTAKPLVENVVTTTALTAGSVTTNGAPVALRGGQSVTIDVSQVAGDSGTGTIEYTDGTQIDLTNVQIASVVFSSNKHQAEITGTATNDGTSVTFAMLVDSGSGGWFSQPSVTMVISGDGINYQATSRVSQGSISVDGTGSSLLPPLSSPAHGQALQSLLHEWGDAIRGMLHGGSGWRL